MAGLVEPATLLRLKDVWRREYEAWSQAGSERPAFCLQSAVAYSNIEAVSRKPSCAKWRPSSNAPITAVQTDVGVDARRPCKQNGAQSSRFDQASVLDGARWASETHLADRLSPTGPGAASGSTSKASSASLKSLPSRSLSGHKPGDEFFDDFYRARVGRYGGRTLWTVSSELIREEVGPKLIDWRSSTRKVPGS